MKQCVCKTLWTILMTLLLCVQECLFQEFTFPLPRVVDDVQTIAARAVAGRLLQSKSFLFNLQVDKSIMIDKRDTFNIIKDRSSGFVNITGSSGVAACWGLNYYLKHYCHCHVSWDGDQLNLPDPLPYVNDTKNAVDIIRYYQNVVTTSYSYVWWDWKRWQREIDWMALNGINMALAFTGQEAIWQRVYLKLTLTSDEIDEHFCGSAFLAWCRMGNIRGWAGPLTFSWHNKMLHLQHQILDSMRGLGIIPVLPGFAGHVPRAFERLFPQANMTKVKPWMSFVDRYCCPYILEPNEPLFHTVGSIFMKELINEFGTDHFYNCDSFNEMTPVKGELEYLSNISAAIYKAMTDVDYEAVWVLQGWLFFSEAAFWNNERVNAYVTSVPSGSMLILDLYSEIHPQYQKLHSYFGQPFIWCMLHNFGGVLGLYGAVDKINKGLFEARSMNGSTMVGIGLTPEGINQNYVIYDLVLDLTWRREPVNLTSWFSSYAQRRYGVTSPLVEAAWQLLKSGVYNFTGSHPENKYIIAQRPNLGLKPGFWYNTTEFQMAWDGFIAAIPELGNSPLFQHDLVDVTRQVLQILGDGYYSRIVESFHRTNLSSFQENADRFLDLLWNMNDILETSNNFLLGSWLNAAKKLATSTLELEMYEFNARNQITLWGPLGEIVDYATKQWSGVVSTYYHPRWLLFLGHLNICLQEHIPFNETAFIADVFENVEQAFTRDTSVFPDCPHGSSIEVAQILYSHWRNNSVWKDLKKFEQCQLTSEFEQYQFTNSDEFVPQVIQILK